MIQKRSKAAAEEAQVWLMADQMVRTVERWIEIKDERQVTMWLKLPDKLRLLRLRTWELRYYVSVHEILSILVPILRKVTSIRTRSKPVAGLGVAIPALVGNAAELILLQELDKRYPNLEHIAAWREDERTIQLERERRAAADGAQVKSASPFTIMHFTSVPDYAAYYHERMVRARNQTERRWRERWRKLRRYRGNPWL